MIKEKTQLPAEINCEQRQKIADRSGLVISLPIAPQIVARTRFSPPPPASNQCISPSEALLLFNDMATKSTENITMAALCGPGDPLATPEITLETISLLRSSRQNLDIGLRTMGIGSSNLAGELAKAGVTHVEMQVEGVRKEILEKLFAWIRPGSKTIKLSEAAPLLLAEQRSGVSALTFHGITVSISTTLYPGYNMDHVAKISSEMVELGAESIILTPYSPHPGAEVSLDPPSCDEVSEAMAKAAAHLPVNNSLFPEKTENFTGDKNSARLLPEPTQTRPNVAVVSSNGMEIDLHLGQAVRFLIYGPRQDGLTCLLEARQAPEPGSGTDRWQKVSSILSDCFILLTASAGQKPRTILNKAGIHVHITEDNIEGLVDSIYGGGKKKKNKKLTP